MKKIIFLLVLMVVSLTLSAQSSHSVSVSWNASPDALANPSLSYTVYRASGSCSGTPVFAKLSSLGGVTGLTYNDLNLAVGNTYCYQVTSVLNGLESLPSNSASAVILPGAPQTLVAIPK